MPAKFQYYKYVGKDSSFGTPVNSIGIKRIDSVVPAVYGNPIIPGDDVSDINMYPVYVPDNKDGVAYSFESVCKLVLKEAPKHQLSNIRLYPLNPCNVSSKSPKLFIGNSITYSRPTNTKSMKAIHDICSYSKDNPFYLTVNGNYGQEVIDEVNILNYIVTYNDIGYGNVIYLNNERQDSPIFAIGNTYQFINKETNSLNFTIFNSVDQTPIVSPYITYALVGDDMVITVNATQELLNLYPNGFLYSDIDNISIGGFIQWLDLDNDEQQIVDYEVIVATDYKGNLNYYMNNVRSPKLNFVENKIYRFTNISGLVYPMRFIVNPYNTIANNEREIVIHGVEIVDGATANEVITVYPSEVKMSGNAIRAYQAVNTNCLGNEITNQYVNKIGNYNINTICGGIANPLSAGETDFIYMQLEVFGDTEVGYSIPEIVIEYDES